MKKEEYGGFMLSYPKSGRTWIKAFFVVYEVITGLKKNILFKHKFNPDYGVMKRLLLVREPCDTLVSLYFHFTVRYGRNVGSIGSFARSKAPEMNDNLKAWMGMKQEVIKYEDLFLGAPVWKKILDWYGIRVVDTAVEEADKACKFDNIRRDLTQFSGLKNSKKFLALEGKNITLTPNDPNAHKFRRGKVGGYVDYLDEEDVAYIRERVPEASRWYEGYNQ